MKFITKLSNRKGSVYSRTIFFGVLLLTICTFVFVMLKSFLICSEVKKRTIGEMNNLSSIIAADVYDANKQGNLTEYYNKLVSSVLYKQQLLTIVKENLVKSLLLTENGNSLIKSPTDNMSAQYNLQNLQLKQVDETDRIEFIISFSLTLQFRIGKNVYDGLVFPVSYSTYHIKNF